MPLLRRRPVPLLPLPNLQGVPDDTQVFYLKATGEVFLDYEAYASRLSFLLNRVFQCEYSGKTNLDYFSALQSEKAESRVVRERFPDALKGKVLGTVQFRVMGRLDSLVDLVYERYKDRFFAGEKVFVDLQGDKYFAQISRSFPPESVRSSLPPTPSSSNAGETDYSSVAHKLGCDLNVDAKTAKSEDAPDEYLYTLQLMDEEGRFEGSSMEVRARALSRDRLSFSKSIMKRYLRECLMRDPAIGSPWMVKPSIAVAFGIPNEQSEGEEERNKKIRDGQLAKRRKTGGGEGETAPAPSKKRKTDSAPTRSSTRGASPSGPAATAIKPKTVKYPIEDLLLEASSVHDGRILRRSNAPPPPLPPKPQGKRDLPLPKEVWDKTVETWNMLNIFAKPLNLSTFSLDDYCAALTHDSLDPRCVLLVEIHASLTNVIGTDNSRVLGSTTAVYAQRVGFGGGGGGGGGGGAAAAETPGPDGETPVREDGNSLDADDSMALDGLNGGGGELDEEQANIAAYEQSELNRLVRLGISYGKRWDRQAKLKYSEGREGWERHLIGALCQRGGPLYLENFVRILRHLFEGHPGLPEQQAKEGEEDVKPDLGTANLPPLPSLPGAAPPTAAAATPLDAVKTDHDPTSSRAGTPVKPSTSRLGTPTTATNGNGGIDDEDLSNPEQAYLSLGLEDKLDIIAYLCTLVMGAKVVRQYLEESDTKLTDLRKERAEVNKEKKGLLETKTAVEQGKPLPPSAAALLSAPATPSTSKLGANGNGAPPSDAAMEVDSRAPSEAGEPPSVGKPADDEEDQLLSDNESTAGGVPASEAGSTASRALDSRAAGLEKLRETAREKTKGITARFTIEDKIKSNSDKDDFVEREFRRYQGVARIRPLGKDRFHNRYWWFDGIGSMDLVASDPSSSSTTAPCANGSDVGYGTGRLFVQGPSEEDWEMVADLKGAGGEEGRQMRERRVVEEVVESEEGLLGVDEWAFYEDEDEIEALLAWLNSKGTRELALKTAIQRWRPFIMAGAEARRFDAANPDLLRADAPPPSVSSNGRRSGRVKAEPELLNTYMGWRNQRARY